MVSDAGTPGTAGQKKETSKLLGCGCGGLLIAAAAFVVLFAAVFVVYPRHQLTKAKAAANELCAAYPVGAPVAGFAARARQLGLEPAGPLPNDPSVPGSGEAQFAYGGVLMDRWICHVETVGGTVTENRVNPLN